MGGGAGGFAAEECYDCPGGGQDGDDEEGAGGVIFVSHGYNVSVDEIWLGKLTGRSLV